MIGERLQDIRKDNQDTQRMLAEKLKVSIATVQSWEQEKSAPNHDMLVAICRLYQVSADYLLGLTNEDPAYTQRHRQALTPENREMLRRFESFLLNEQKTTAKNDR